MFGKKSHVFKSIDCVLKTTHWYNWPGKTVGIAEGTKAALKIKLLLFSLIYQGTYSLSSNSGRKEEGSTKILSNLIYLKRPFCVLLIATFIRTQFKFGVTNHANVRQQWWFVLT